jgi:hypothetical protein
MLNVQVIYRQLGIARENQKYCFEVLFLRLQQAQRVGARHGFGAAARL